MKRSEFLKATKRAAFDRCNGFCELCGGKILTAEYDHYPVPAALGGSNELSNCRVLCKKCHRKITATVDVPAIAKSNRIWEKRAGLRKTRRPFQRRADPWGRGRDA